MKIVHTLLMLTERSIDHKCICNQLALKFKIYSYLFVKLRKEIGKKPFKIIIANEREKILK